MCNWISRKKGEKERGREMPEQMMVEHFPNLVKTCNSQFQEDFPVAQTVKHPPAAQETQVRALGQEDPLEKGMATHSSILTWRVPRTEEPVGGVQFMGVAMS